jgi:ATP synthase protein I
MKEEDKKYLRDLANASTLGIQVALCIFLGLAIGLWLDSKFGTSPWLTIVFLLFGLAAAFVTYYRFVRSQQNKE